MRVLHFVLNSFSPYFANPNKDGKPLSSRGWPLRRYSIAYLEWTNHLPKMEASEERAQSYQKGGTKANPEFLLRSFSPRQSVQWRQKCGVTRYIITSCLLHGMYRNGETSVHMSINYLIHVITLDKVASLLPLKHWLHDSLLQTVIPYASW